MNLFFITKKKINNSNKTFSEWLFIFLKENQYFVNKKFIYDPNKIYFSIKISEKFYFKDLITWKKQRGHGIRKGWLYTREEILWYVKDNKHFIWNNNEQYLDEKRPWNVYKKGGKMVNKSEYKRISNVWTDINEVGFGTSPKEFSEIRNEIKHLTPKPFSAIERIIKAHTKENDIILDPFMGSASTAIACIKTNRKYIGSENNKEIYNNSINRINNFLKK